MAKIGTVIKNFSEGAQRVADLVDAGVKKNRYNEILDRGLLAAKYDTTYANAQKIKEELQNFSSVLENGASGNNKLKAENFRLAKQEAELSDLEKIRQIFVNKLDDDGLLNNYIDVGEGQRSVGLSSEYFKVGELANPVSKTPLLGAQYATTTKSGLQVTGIPSVSERRMLQGGTGKVFSDTVTPITPTYTYGRGSIPEDNIILESNKPKPTKPENTDTSFGGEELKRYREQMEAERKQYGKTANKRSLDLTDSAEAAVGETNGSNGRNWVRYAVGAATGGGLIFALSDSRGQQTNAQLYGQQPLY